MSVKHLYLMTAAALMGCAATNSAPSSGAPTRKANILTFDEISAAHADVTTAYDAVARLRPNWLASHGVTSAIGGGTDTEYATVFIDGQPYGGIESLRNIPVYHVGEFRYYSITEAGAKYGLRGGSSGVIELTMNLQSRL
ncbi:MAG TPA: hypothetical protein VIM21_09690 [Gemmatimonadaceae bacterium]